MLRLVSSFETGRLLLISCRKKHFSGIIFNITNSQESKLKFDALRELKMIQTESTVSMN